MSKQASGSATPAPRIADQELLSLDLAIKLLRGSTMWAHERHWRESLPQNQKALFARTANAEEMSRLSDELHAREKSRKEEWELAKRQWQPNKVDQPKPWPFRTRTGMILAL